MSEMEGKRAVVAGAPGRPLVSVVTAVRNGRATLGRAIDSVLAQTYSPIEHVIIDGASLDGTVELLESYTHNLGYWVSEPDEGVYEAMNKGVAASRGDIIGVLNADDWYEPDAVSRAVEAIEVQGADYCYGAVRAHLDDKPVAVNRPVEGAKLATRALFEMPFCHISLFVRRRVYEQIGPFDTRYRIAADHDFVVRLVRGPFEGRDLGVVVGNVAWGGLSSTRQAPREALRVGLSHGLSPLSGYAFCAWKLMRVTARTSLGLSIQRMLSRLLGMKHEWVK